MVDNSWQRKFEDPIPLPDGRKLLTLKALHLNMKFWNEGAGGTRDAGAS
jgi:hypothetical protein